MKQSAIAVAFLLGLSASKVGSAQPTPQAEQCIAVPTPACVGDLAVEAAVQAGTLSRRSYLLSQIVEGQAAQGLIADAVATSELVRNPQNRVVALTTIAEAQRLMGDRDGAAANLAEALTFVDAIDRDYVRDRLLASIAIEQARAGEFGAAREIAVQMRPSVECSILKQIAISQAETGDFQFAFETLDGVSCAYHVASALREIAVMQFEHNDAVSARFTLAQALQQVETRDRVDANALAVWNIAAGWAEIGDEHSAADVARLASAQALPIDDLEFRDASLADIARFQFRIGDPAGALATARQISDLEIRQRILGGAGIYFEGPVVGNATLTAVTLIDAPGLRIEALSQIAMQQSRSGNTQGALETLEIGLAQIREAIEGAGPVVAHAGALDSSSERLYLAVAAMLFIALAQDELGFAAEAEATLVLASGAADGFFGSMPYPMLRALIGKAWAEIGCNECARSEIEAAIGAIDDLSGSPDTANAEDLAIIQAEIARIQFGLAIEDQASASIQRAIAAALQVDDVRAKNYVLREIAGVQIAVPDYDGALSTATLIESAGDRAFVRREVSTAQAADGDYSNAVATLVGIEDPVLRAGALAWLLAEFDQN